jgi:predicted alpha/beta-fold hydrolase
LSALLIQGRDAGPFPPFTPRFPWIGGDLQTVRNTLVWKSPDLADATRLMLPVSGGDTLWALLNMPSADTGKPLIILVHGLTGDEDSANIMSSAAWHRGRGYPVLRLTLRGAGPSLATSLGHYHAGRSADLRDAVAALPAHLRDRGLLIAGTSLGGNVVLKFLAENEDCTEVIAGVSISAPIDLRVAQMRIMEPRNGVYQRHLLKQMTADALKARGPQRVLYEANAPRIHTIYDFDDLIVAPGNGFAGAEDYYARASAGPLLDRIAVPTLVIHARNDPWVPASMYLSRAWRTDGSLTLLMPADGGHVGFHGAGDPVPWHDRAIAAFFDRML